MKYLTNEDLRKLGWKEKIVVSFSGGKTSAYMSWWLVNTYGHKYEFIFIFANTGQECEETLVFVDKCDKAFGLNVVWVEAVVNPIHGKGITHKIVDFKTADRNGEPFEAHIAKSGIPNANKPQCSDRLKALPIEDYKKVNNLTGVKHAIGMRGDEPNRVFHKQKRDTLTLIGIDADMWRLDSKEQRKLTLDAYSEDIELIVDNLGSENDKKAFKSKVKSLYEHNKFNLIYPLCDWEEIDKQDVNTFWEDQEFTLNLEEHQGNCKTCWKKSDKKLWLIAIEEPEKFNFMLNMEDKYQHVKPNDDGKPRVFFRKHRGVNELMAEAEKLDSVTLRKMIGYKDDQESGCSESCEAYA